MQRSINKLFVFVVFLFILVGLIVKNIHLSAVRFYDWDEAMYARIATELIQNKTIFTTFNGQVWLDKPPLTHLIVAASFLLFGQSEFWARMGMVAIAFLLLILVYKTSQKILKTPLLSMLPVFLLAGSPIFLDRSALLNSDTLVALSWLGYLLYQDSYWGRLFFLTIGVWSKSVMGLYPLAIDIIKGFFNVWLKNKLPVVKLTGRNLVKMFLFISLPSSWYIVNFFKYGNDFLYQHFASQVFKRISVPIELHVGDKFYYLNYLWNNLGLVNFIFIAGYLFFFYYLITGMLKKEKKFFTPDILFTTTVMLAPFPFFIFLTFMKTKIYWYVIMFFPFVCLTVLNYFLFFKNKLFQSVLVVIIFVYFLISFSQQTFFTRRSTEKPPERVQLALCLSWLTAPKIGYLVDKDERKVRNVLEAAHYDTTSSFFYGGSPSFVFYSQKKIDFFYSIDDFIKQHKNYSLVVVSRHDLETDPSLKTAMSKGQTGCHTENWVSIVQ